MRNYNQLSRVQRYQIEILNKAGKQKEMAEFLGVSGLTACRELQRNRGKKAYSPKQAAKALKITVEVIVEIEVRN